jgi:hypothetical protein
MNVQRRCRAHKLPMQFIKREIGARRHQSADSRLVLGQCIGLLPTGSRYYRPATLEALHQLDHAAHAHCELLRRLVRDVPDSTAATIRLRKSCE